MNNTIFYLIGTTSAVRLTIAQEIAALTGAKVIDSQAIYTPIFPLLASSRLSDIPDAAWDEVDVVRGAILRTIETLSPKDWNFVFTHAGLDIPADIRVYRTVRDMAARRGSAFAAVTLTGEKPQKLFRFEEPTALAVETGTASPDEVAARIVASAGWVKTRGGTPSPPRRARGEAPPRRRRPARRRRLAIRP